MKNLSPNDFIQSPTQNLLQAGLLGGAILQQQVQQNLDRQIIEEAKQQRYTINLDNMPIPQQLASSRQEPIQSEMRPRPLKQAFDQSVPIEERQQLLNQYRDELTAYLDSQSNAQQIDLTDQDRQYSDVINDSPVQSEDQSDNSSLGSVTEFNALLDGDDELRADLQDLQRQINDEDIDPSFGNRLIQHLRTARDRLDFRVRYEQVKKFISLGPMGFQLFKEYQLFTKPITRIATDDRAKDDSDFMSQTIDNELPKHCRRIYYRSSEGVLHSRVICESFNMTRSYLDH